MPLFHTSNFKFCVLIVLVSAFLGTTKSARGETTSASGATAITSLPYPITQPGSYYLASDLSIHLADFVTAIAISVPNVTLDLNGHTLTDTDGLAGYEFGIYITADHVAVCNGSVVGFCYDMVVAGNGCRIENLTLRQATYTGILFQGANNLMQQCRVLNTGGSTRPYFDPSAGAIEVQNDYNRIIDCDVAGVTANPGGLCQGIGVYTPDANTMAMIVGNRVSNCYQGIAVYGVTTKMRDNLCTASVSVPYTGGQDAGNNQ